MTAVRGQGILDRLTGGDRRSVGRVDEVVAAVRGQPDLFVGLMAGFWEANALVRMRAADAVEKLTARRPELLQPYKAAPLTQASVEQQQEVRWHLAQILPRLQLALAERGVAFETLLPYLDDVSRIVQAFTLQALAALAAGDASLEARVLPLLEAGLASPSAAVRSRARKLLRERVRQQTRSRRA